MIKTHSDAIVYYVGAWMMLNITDSDLTATVIMKVSQSFCFHIQLQEYVIPPAPAPAALP